MLNFFITVFVMLGSLGMFFDIEPQKVESLFLSAGVVLMVKLIVDFRQVHR